MKRLLTTVLVLAMIATMFCVSPVVSAADGPAMEISVTANSNGEDPITATFANVSDAKWVVFAIKDDTTGEYIFMDEKRGNKAQAEPFVFTFAAEETAIKAHTYFTAEAKITMADNTVTTLSKAFEFRSFDAVQGIIREVLADPQTKTIEQAKTMLSFSLPAYYANTYDDIILSYVRPLYAAQLANPYNSVDPTTHIDTQDFYDKLNDKTLLAVLNSNDTTAIANILDNHYTDAGIAAADNEYIWWDNDLDKAAIATKLSAYTYGDTVDFVNQFKTEVFLTKLSGTYSDAVINFLRTNNNTYTNYGTATNLTSGTVTNLDFATFDSLVGTSAIRAAYAETYMATTYANLDALEDRFNDLLAALPGINEPTTPTPTPSPSPAPGTTLGGNTVSVGLTAPIVGENSIPFTDLDDVEWAKEAIRALYLEGVVEGVSAKQFLPNANVTREQFVKIIVNTFGLKGTGVVAPFTDVDQNQWYAPFINTAVELGIINGVSETEFGVGQNITRQDMTVIMYRVAKYIGKNLTAKTTKMPKDMDSIDDYAYEAVVALYQAEIVNGVAEGVVAGWQTATRAQAAKLCYDLREVK